MFLASVSVRWNTVLCGGALKVQCVVGGIILDEPKTYLVPSDVTNTCERTVNHIIYENKYFHCEMRMDQPKCHAIAPT